MSVITAPLKDNYSIVNKDNIIAVLYNRASCIGFETNKQYNIPELQYLCDTAWKIRTFNSGHVTLKRLRAALGRIQRKQKEDPPRVRLQIVTTRLDREHQAKSTLSLYSIHL